MKKIKSYNNFINEGLRDKMKPKTDEEILLSIKNMYPDEILKKVANFGSLMLVKFALERGADIHTNNDYAFRLAATNGHLDVVKYLVEQGANIHANNDNALQSAAQEGHLDVVKYLVDKGVNIHIWDDYALRWAANKGHLDVVKYLVDKGANIHADNDYALRYAAQNGYLDVVKYLVDKGVNIHIWDDYALCWAAEKGHLDIVKYLADKGANIHAEDDNALRWAANKGHLDVVKYLVDKGANIHADNDYALRYAVKYGHSDVVDYLKKQMGLNEGLTDKMKPKSIDDIKLAFIKLMEHYDNPLTNFIDDDFILKISEVSQTLNEQKQNLHLISEWDDEYNIVSEIFEALTQNDEPIIIKVISEDNPNGYGGGEWRCFIDKKLAYYSPEVFDEGSVWVFNKEYFKK